MLTLHVPESEYYLEAENRFINLPAVTLRLEHSLVSLSKWESKWKQPFLSVKELTGEKLVDYIGAMNMTQNVDPLVFQSLREEDIIKIQEYIGDSMTATTFNEANKPGSARVVTSELIYYWMFAFNVPLECQKWHLNRLLTLLRVCSIETNRQSGKKKHMSREEIIKRNNALNEQRRKALNTTG